MACYYASFARFVLIYTHVGMIISVRLSPQLEKGGWILIIFCMDIVPLETTPNS
jgi:hypothetical protein